MKSLILFIISLAGLIVASVFYFPTLDKASTQEIILLITIIVCFVLVIVFAILTIRSYYGRRASVLKKRLDMWTNLSYHVNQVGDEVINEIPIGILVIDDEYEIKWVNNYAKEILTPNLIEQSLFDISKDFEAIKEHDTFTISTVNAKFECLYKPTNKAIYLFDVTKREEITLKYTNSIPALGYIDFDNLEDAFAGFDYSFQQSVKTDYLTAIYEWAEQYDAFLTSLSEDRLLLVTSREQLNLMTKDKLSILNTIMEISKRHSLKVTISIGIASWDVAYEDLEKYAQNAIELAERRGGDQAVINIQDQKIEYFGGNADALSTVSRVVARVNAQKLRELIENASNVLIMGHIEADVDAFGAMLVVNRIVSALGVKGYMVLDKDRIDKTVTMTISKLKEVDPKLLSNTLTTAESLRRINNETLLIVVDTQVPNLVHSPEILNRVSNIAVLDHHRTGDNTIESTFSYIETASSSSVELCFELLQFFNNDIEITPIEATIMYAGLIIDTSDFTNRTSPRTFEVAAKLIELDADATQVKIWLRKDLMRTLEINRLMDKMEIYRDQFALVKTNTVYQDRVLLAQVSDEMLSIDTVSAAFTVAKIAEDVVGVSARSFAPINVQVIMEELGGGGHLQSAAAQIENKTVDEVYDHIKQLIDIEYGGGEKESMKVILISDVKGKGNKDEVIEVAAGYGQFLINSKQAITASPENLKELELAKQKAIEAEEKHQEIMKKLKSEIDGKAITIGIQIGKDDKLFGAVTTKQIVEEFENEFGIKLDKKKVTLSSEINSLGIYTATVELYRGIKAQFDVNIVEK